MICISSHAKTHTHTHAQTRIPSHMHKHIGERSLGGIGPHWTDRSGKVSSQGRHHVLFGCSGPHRTSVGCSFRFSAILGHYWVAIIIAVRFLSGIGRMVVQPFVGGGRTQRHYPCVRRAQTQQQQHISSSNNNDPATTIIIVARTCHTVPIVQPPTQCSGRMPILT